MLRAAWRRPFLRLLLLPLVLRGPRLLLPLLLCLRLRAVLLRLLAVWRSSRALNGCRGD